MQFPRQLSVFPSALLLSAPTGTGLPALFASAGSPSLLGLLGAGLAAGLIDLTMLPRHWKRVARIEESTDASSGGAEVPSLARTVLFLLILTGPLRLRFRDPMASIRGLPRFRLAFAVASPQPSLGLQRPAYLWPVPHADSPALSKHPPAIWYWRLRVDDESKIQNCPSPTPNLEPRTPDRSPSWVCAWTPCRSLTSSN